MTFEQSETNFVNLNKKKQSKAGMHVSNKSSVAFGGVPIPERSRISFLEVSSSLRAAHAHASQYQGMRKRNSHQRSQDWSQSSSRVRDSSGGDFKQTSWMKACKKLVEQAKEQQKEGFVYFKRIAKGAGPKSQKQNSLLGSNSAHLDNSPKKQGTHFF